jgi:hypothetical protein
MDMKIFLRNLFLFIFLFAVVVSGIVGAASAYMNSVRFDIDNSKNILVIGDSHTECAIDDSSFSRAANFSKSATSFVYSYAALRKLIADNPHIDTVLLSYHSSSLSLERERGWIFDETAMTRQVPVFLPYFGCGEFMLFSFRPEFLKHALHAPWSALDYYKNSQSGRRQHWIDENIGNFRDLGWSNFAKDTARTKPLRDRVKRDTVSLVAVNYIKKFAAFCRERNITLFLFNSPVYEWNKYVNDEEFDENKETFLKDIVLLDYSGFPIADSCRLDIWHLNGAGARQFSKYLDSNLVRDIKHIKKTTL